MPRLTNRRATEEDDEGFYVSMSDMLTGLLFIFIILLVYYAVHFRQKEVELTGAKEARSRLLNRLEDRMRNRGIPVKIVDATGVLRFSDPVDKMSTKILFSDRSSTLTPYGEKAVAALADELMAVLPCYTDEPKYTQKCEEVAQFKIDVLLIEGHSDKRRFFDGGSEDRNLELSAQRAITTYKALRNQQPSLDALKTEVGSGDEKQMTQILSVSGYGGTRPAFGYDGDDAASLAVNRRIDLRFLMATPDVTVKKANQP